MWQLILQTLPVWAVISLIPMGMYVVAYIFESRRPGNPMARGIPDLGKIPIWAYQSRAMIPGDFGLTLFTAVGVILGLRVEPLREWSSSGQAFFAAATASCLTVAVGRYLLYDRDSYVAAAWRSPSKRYHDYVMFGAFPFAVVLYAVPGYATVMADGALSEMVYLAVMGFAGAMVWIWGLVYDARVKQVPNQYQHPSMWWPIWQDRLGSPFWCAIRAAAHRWRSSK